MEQGQIQACTRAFGDTGASYHAPWLFPVVRKSLRSRRMRSTIFRRRSCIQLAANMAHFPRTLIQQTFGQLLDSTDEGKSAAAQKARTEPSSVCSQYFTMYPTLSLSQTVAGQMRCAPAPGYCFNTSMSPRGRNMTSGLAVWYPMRRTNCGTRGHRVIRLML